MANIGQLSDCEEDVNRGTRRGSPVVAFTQYGPCVHMDSTYQRFSPSTSVESMRPGHRSFYSGGKSHFPTTSCAALATVRDVDTDTDIGQPRPQLSIHRVGPSVRERNRSILLKRQASPGYSPPGAGSRSGPNSLVPIASWKQHPGPYIYVARLSCQDWKYHERAFWSLTGDLTVLAS